MKRLKTVMIMNAKTRNRWLIGIGCLAIIILPLILNWCILLEEKWNFIGDGTDWLGFFGSYIGVVISTAIALYILYFNKKDSDEKHNQLLKYQMNFNRYIYEKGEYEELCRKINHINTFLKEYEIDNKHLNVDVQLSEIRLFYKLYGIDFKSLSDQENTFCVSLKKLIDYWDEDSLLNSKKELFFVSYRKEIMDKELLKEWLVNEGLSSSFVYEILNLNNIEAEIKEIDKALLAKKIRDFDNLSATRKDFRDASFELLKERQKSLNDLLNRVTEKQ